MKGCAVKPFFVAFFAFIITDAAWLGLIAKNLYIEQYGQWLRIVDGQLQPIWWAALIVYMLFALSVVIFSLPLSNHSLLKSAGYGAILGAIIYGIYDFTCIAIFKDFPIVMGFIDWAWGITLCAWCSLVTSVVVKYNCPR